MMSQLKDGTGSYSYRELNDLVDNYKYQLKNLGVQKGERIALLLNPGVEFVAWLLAVWQCEAVCVPMCVVHPVDELKHVVSTVNCAHLVHHSNFEKKARELNVSTVINASNKTNKSTRATLIKNKPEDNALILFTSGSTGKPKGVVHTHGSLKATISAMVNSWNWSKKDHILHILPLHHTHGLINKLLCALETKASITFLNGFNAEEVWKHLTNGDVNVFMAVPTVYNKLIAFWKAEKLEKQNQMTKALDGFRLMISGSAALPIPVLKKWKEISGHILLERYGMTEIGMAISNPYNGERRAGYIGQAMPGVNIRLVSENGEPINEENVSGEIQIKGDNVFKEYWGNPTATNESFTKDGWFKTGDIAEVNKGYFKILGRNSVDIIKTGGYKVSALEIENVLLTHVEIDSCAVIGIEDITWGEKVVVAIEGEINLNLEQLTLWAKNKLAPYKIPKQLLVVKNLPRNAMGKVLKKEVKKLFNFAEKQEGLVMDPK